MGSLPNFTALPRVTLTEEVTSTIKNAIFAGQFEDAQQLTESRISKEFKISRAPVREALRQLANTGLVTYRPNRGYFLRKFEIKDIEEICQLRTAIEKLAVAQAIKHASDQEIGELEEIVRKMKLFTRKKIPKMSEASFYDYEFHQKICLMAHSSLLSEIWNTMSDQSRAAFVSINKAYEAVTGYVSGHREIVEAIRSRNIERAQNALEEHIMSGLENLKSSMSRKADSG